MSKKITALFLALCLILSLAACSSGGSGAQLSPEENTEAPQENSEPGKEPSPPAETETAPADESGSEEEPAGTSESGLRPAKTAEDPIFDEDTQELMTYIAKAISEEYLVPNGISANEFVWPTDPAAWDYYNGVTANEEHQTGLLDQIYTEIAIGADNPVDEALIPASPDKEIMDAVAHGITNWLQQFERVESGYLDHLFSLLRDSQYLMDNVTFE